MKITEFKSDYFIQNIRTKVLQQNISPKAINFKEQTFYIKKMIFVQLFRNPE